LRIHWEGLDHNATATQEYRHMEVIEAIRRKRAVRNYTDEPLPAEAIERIIYAGRRAQSSKNTQPWHFVVIRDGEMLSELSKLGDFARHLPSAAMAVAILTPDPVAYYWVMFDAGQAAAYMQLEGVELGIGSCMVTLHRPEPSRALLGYPEDLHLRMVIAFGYPADPGALEPAARPGGRLPSTQTVHYERFGQHEAPGE
jgi:nitroreductase